MSKDLYIKHLSPQTTDEDLRKLFAVAGKVTYVFLVTDKESGTFLNCAYVSMATDKEAKEAITALDGARYMNSVIEVIEALPRRTGAGGKASAGKTPRPRVEARPKAERSAKLEAKQIARGDWTAPAKKSRAKAEDRPKPERVRKNDTQQIAQEDWTAPAKKERVAPTTRRKTETLPRAAGPKRGPGSKGK